MPDELEPQVVPTLEPDPQAVSPPEPAPDPQPAEPQPEPRAPEPPSWSFLQAAREAGFPVDSFESDEAAARALLSHTRRLEMERQQPQPPAEPEPDPAAEWDPNSHFQKMWPVPEYNPQWMEHLEIDQQSGQIRPKPNTPPGLGMKYMEEYAAHQAALRQNHQSLFMQGNPYQKMWEALRPVMENEGYVRRQDLQNEFGQREVASHVQQFEQEYSQYLQSDDGKRFIAYCGDLVNEHRLSPDAALRAAYSAFRPKSNQEWEPKEPAPQPTEPQPNPPKPSSFVEDSVRKAGHRPSSGAPAPGPTDPGQRDPEAVRSIFTRAHSAAGKAS